MTSFSIRIKFRGKWSMQICLLGNFWACVAMQEMFVSRLQGHSLDISWGCQSLETVVFNKILCVPVCCAVRES